jgi:hypothetical protein
VNYSPDRAVRFDVEGNPVRVYDRAHSPVEITVSLGRRPSSPSEIETLLGAADRPRWPTNIRTGANTVHTLSTQ